MSIGWMTRVWASAEPSHPTDRLMLLALADNANDEGRCWPSLETLQGKCRLRTLRGARKVLGRLEASGYVRRLARPGRSNVYELVRERLGTPERLESPGREKTPERQDRGGDHDAAEVTPERADRGGTGVTPEPGDRGGGTVVPGRAEPRDRVPRNAGTGRTHREPSTEPIINNSDRCPGARRTGEQRTGGRRHGGRRRGGQGDDGAHEGVVVDLGSGLVKMLVDRGVHAPVARRLLEQYGAGAVRAQIEHYDALCAERGTPRRPGWLVQAIKEGYPLPQARRVAAKRFTYQEMLAWCEARGDLGLTRWFTPVKQEGKTLFRLTGTRGGPAMTDGGHRTL